MWKLKELYLHCIMNQVAVGNEWLPAKPLNSEKQYISFFQRIKRAWMVFTCKADCFIWPDYNKEVTHES